MIRVENLHLVQGAFRLSGVTFEVPTGRYGVLMGRTGCGKTSILEAICGLRPIAGGAIRLGDRVVTALKPAARNIGYVPQDGALFTTMTVREQLGFSLSVRRWPKARIAERVEELAGMLGVGHLLDRKPRGLSGGETQRVALGRALAPGPSVLLMDEPLSALDEQTRAEMYELLKSVQRRTGVTTLHVTHNPGETRSLADHLFVLADGRIAERQVSAALSRTCRETTLEP